MKGEITGHSLKGLKSLSPTWLMEGIWSFKRKRFPSGALMKHKAQLCAHGGMQIWGIDFWETYSPVVNWITVRTLLAIAAIHNLPTSSIDFVLAFPHAELDVIVTWSYQLVWMFNTELQRIMC